MSVICAVCMNFVWRTVCISVLSGLTSLTILVISSLYNSHIRDIIGQVIVIAQCPRTSKFVDNPCFRFLRVTNVGSTMVWESWTGPWSWTTQRTAVSSSSSSPCTHGRWLPGQGATSSLTSCSPSAPFTGESSNVLRNCLLVMFSKLNYDLICRQWLLVNI